MMLRTNIRSQAHWELNKWTQGRIGTRNWVWLRVRVWRL